MLIESDGPIQSIEISQNWYGEPIHLVGDSFNEFYWVFWHVADPLVRWALYCEGRKTSAELGKKYHERLFKAGLSLSGSACEEVTKWYRPLPLAGDSTDISLHTGNLNGRLALFLRRSWVLLDDGPRQAQALHTIVDAVGDGTLICELTYNTNADRFDQYLPEAQMITNSVIWRPTESDGDWKAGGFGMYVKGKRVDGRRQGDRPITKEEWFSENYPPYKR